MQKKYLIIGTSAAGLSAAHTIRKLDKTGLITCITQEKELSYNKCFLADFLTSTKVYPTFKTEQFFVDNNIEVVTDCTIVKINKEKKCVSDSTGKMWQYDSLLLATGGNIVRPETQTNGSENVFDFYTYAETEKLKEYAQRTTTQNILIVGAGLSGLECADALEQYKKNITLVERAERVLSHQITPGASQFLEEKIKGAGIACITNTVVQDFVIKDNKVTQVVLVNGTTCSVDMVIYALGARPNLELPRNTGLEIQDNAVVTNEFLQTSDEAIFAAGDICRVYNTLAHTYTKSCTWPDAMQQGMYAGHNMVSLSKPYKGAAPIISSSFFGMKFFVAGRLYAQDNEDKISVVQEDNQYTMILSRNNKIEGFIIFGDNSQFFELKQSLLS